MVVAPLHFRTGGRCFLNNSCLRAAKQTTLQGQAAFKSGTLFKSLCGKTCVTGVVHGEGEWIVMKKNLEMTESFQEIISARSWKGVI